jgi:hypothetical protein
VTSAHAWAACAAHLSPDTAVMVLSRIEFVLPPVIGNIVKATSETGVETLLPLVKRAKLASAQWTVLLAYTIFELRSVVLALHRERFYGRGHVLILAPGLLPLDVKLSSLWQVQDGFDSAVLEVLQGALLLEEAWPDRSPIADGFLLQLEAQLGGKPAALPPKSTRIYDAALLFAHSLSAVLSQASDAAAAQAGLGDIKQLAKTTGSQKFEGLSGDIEFETRYLPRMAYAIYSFWGKQQVSVVSMVNLRNGTIVATSTPNANMTLTSIDGNITWKFSGPLHFAGNTTEVPRWTGWCYPGYSADRVACKPCAPGFFTPSGTPDPNTGFHHEMSPTQCPAGTFQAHDYATSCDICPAGYPFPLFH